MARFSRTRSWPMTSFNRRGRSRESFQSSGRRSGETTREATSVMSAIIQASDRGAGKDRHEQIAGLTPRPPLRGEAAESPRHEAERGIGFQGGGGGGGGPSPLKKPPPPPPPTSHPGPRPKG